MSLSISIVEILSFVTALIAVAIVHPIVCKVATRLNVLDNPDARKLQRRPIPLLGGVAVFFGIMMGLCVASFATNVNTVFPIVVAMVLMLSVGTADDVVGLTPSLRFCLEIATVVALIFITKSSLNDFHGLWGVCEISRWVSIPLTIFAVVGVINAINLIDGVDGLSSGFCIMASIVFGAVFFYVGNVEMTLLALVSIGALIPFFFHNVFGRSSKMFIGDGGTLMMGVVISSYIVMSITSGTKCELLVERGFGVIPFTLAVLAVPVFDTLRVMAARIARHTSPFYPDKTHLHHLFIELGFSHAGTTVSVLTLNSLVLCAWLLAYLLGASIDVQLYVVLACGFMITFAFYGFMKRQIARNTAIYRVMNKLGHLTRIERRGVWLFLQMVADGKQEQDNKA